MQMQTPKLIATRLDDNVLQMEYMCVGYVVVAKDVLQRIRCAAEALVKAYFPGNTELFAVTVENWAGENQGARIVVLVPLDINRKVPDATLDQFSGAICAVMHYIADPKAFAED